MVRLTNGKQMSIRQTIGRKLARYLSHTRNKDVRVATSPPPLLAATIRKGDVLLVEGHSRISAAIKYLTQSTWSHAALCVNDFSTIGEEDPAAIRLLEADVSEGVRVVPLSKYWHLHTRICRPVSLTPAEIDQVVAVACARIGDQYDLKNIFDLARYLIRTPPVPTHLRRRLLALGSGDPTRAICSSLIAQAFQSVQYPILPEIVKLDNDDPSCEYCYREFLHIRHHSLFAPRDFDISPYFQIVKPTITCGFDHHRLSWLNKAEDGAYRNSADRS